jgi:antitoxin CptB
MMRSDLAAADRGRLLWRCRRGMKELDVLLERYARWLGSAARPQEQGAFARLLELPDPLLAAYLLGPAVPRDPELARLVRQIIAGAQGHAGGP